MEKKNLKRVVLSMTFACLLGLFLNGEIASAADAPNDSVISFEKVQTPVLLPRVEVPTISRQQKEALTLLNADRAAHGLPPLRLSLPLSMVAENYARDMKKRQYFAHTNPEGLSPFDRLKNSGIDFSCAGENLAFNVSISAAQQAFMDSPGHKANILNANYTQVGISVITKDSQTLYVVQEFSD